MELKLKNFDIDKFNRDVNMSGGPDVQYESWAEYRTRVSAFIDSALENVPGAKSAAVYGAGSLNDIDMSFLCGNFERIALVDADTQSIEDGLKRQGLSEGDKAKTEIHKADFSGAQKAGFFAGLEKLAKRTAPAGELTGYIEKTITAMEPDPSAGDFDIVISCPVYTQLVYTQTEVFLKILYEYGLYEYRELNTMLNAAYRAMPGVLERYNDVLIDACREGGHIIVLADVMEMPAGGPLLKRIYRLMEEVPLDCGKIERHLKKNGIELSLLGLEDFFSKTETLSSFYAIWPFGGEKEYLIYGAHAKNTIL